MKKIVILSFFIYFIIGIFIFSDFGSGWDESMCIKNGFINGLEINKKFNYIIVSKEKAESLMPKTIDTSKMSDLNNFKDKVYGSINEIIITGPALLLKMHNDYRKVIFVRHFMIFFIFFISSIYFYRLLRIKYKELTSLICTFLLILTPKIFAESFYNSKDLIFLSAIIIAFYYCVKFITNTNYKFAILAALFSALAIDIRIPGIILPVLCFGLFVIYHRKNILKYSTNKNLLIFSSSLPLFIYIFWPYLWDNPIHNFIIGFSAMKKFIYDLNLKYLGEIVNSTDLSWHYIPVQILVTTPLFILVLVFMGLILFAKKYKSIFKEENFIELFSFLLFLSPLLAVIIFHSVLYDGWRQMYFIYPPLIVLTAGAIEYLLNVKNVTYLKTIKIAIACNFLYLFYILISMHPYQMVYFNILASNQPQKYFEGDYWGLCMQEILQKLIKLNPNNEIKIFNGEFSPLASNLRFLSEKDRAKFKIVSIDSADYLFSFYKEVYQDTNLLYKRYNLKKNQLVLNRHIGNINLYSVFRIDSTNKIDSSLDKKIITYEIIHKYKKSEN